MKRAKTTCRCISFSFRATNPKSEQSSNFLFLMPKEKKPKQWVSPARTLRAQLTCRTACYTACGCNAGYFKDFRRATFNATGFPQRRRPRVVGFQPRRRCRVTISRHAVERCTRLERVFLVLFLQRASVLTGSFRVKIGASRNSSGETFFWMRPTGCCRTTNSRYSVRYIPLYVDRHIYSISLLAHTSPAERAPLTFRYLSTGQRRGGQREHLRAE